MNLNKTTIILAIALVALLTWNIRGCFTKVEKPEKMIRNEVELEHLKKELPVVQQELTAVTAKYDSAISVSQERSNQLSNSYKATKIIYEKIPVIVNDFDREQLRRALADY